MQNNDTQPLSPDQVPLTLEEQIESVNHPSVTAFLQAVKKGMEANLPPHVHGPFTFLMNQNHNALRGCNTCGQTWVGVMAGVSEADLSWHPVQELEEEEEEEEEEFRL